MAESHQSYDRTVKIPCESLEIGRPCKTDLDGRIKEAVTSITKGSGHWQCEWHNDTSGNTRATIKNKSSVVSLQTKYGQNVAFVSGERHVFISYGIHADCIIAALERVADKAENLRLMMKIIGGIAGPFVLFGLFSLILRLMGFVIIPYVLIAVALDGGIWGGGKLGDLLGSMMEQRAGQRAEKQGAIAEKDALIGMLTLKLDQIIEPYERV